MKPSVWLLATLCFPACGFRPAAVDRDVRAFVRTVADDVTREGPAAWRKHFSDSPAFFMASAGHLEFSDSASATAAIQSLAGAISHIDLQWGDKLRVDPLTSDLAVVAVPFHEVLVQRAGGRVEVSGYFTGTAERRAGRWRFRNAHWSMADPIPPAR